ncbi:MAG: hypothetical protein ACD_52C00044G0003 [uncultured bacterium]|nr:MAG: hypothetical protein ACD_52C00044G0003 [uncultured bacterium]
MKNEESLLPFYKGQTLHEEKQDMKPKNKVHHSEGKTYMTVSYSIKNLMDKK